MCCPIQCNTLFFNTFPSNLSIFVVFRKTLFQHTHKFRMRYIICCNTHVENPFILKKNTCTIIRAWRLVLSPFLTRFIRESGHTYSLILVNKGSVLFRDYSNQCINYYRSREIFSLRFLNFFGF